MIGKKLETILKRRGITHRYLSAQTDIPYWDCRFDVNRGEISKWLYCIVKNYKTQLSYKDN